MSANSADLSKRIEAASRSKPVQTKLTTNERVLARITDGIYRQPSSALRELISNAYDADATEVVILTDAPRFQSIIVRDDGQGFSCDTLAHMLTNIGGSAKRTELGKTLHTTSEKDSDYSDGGRKLIGKLGIGLFAVSQFTRHFMVVTKQTGDKYRTVADITLGSTSEEAAKANDRSGKPEIETGNALIYREAVAKDEIASHGTEIRLLELLPRTRAELASLDWWTKIDFQKSDTEEEEITVDPPRFHIGRMKAGSDTTLVLDPKLPWSDEESSIERFQTFVERVRELALTDKELVDLDKVCDRYLQTMWTLALASPIDYVGKHPFDLTDDDALFFMLDNRVKGQAKPVPLKGGKTIRSAVGLKEKDGNGFRIEIDGVQLARPIVFTDQPQSSAALKRPLMFVGKYREDFKGKPKELSGGVLEFEGYLFWTPKVVPTQHQGVLVRVGNASGALFDRTYMGYQVSEQTRLRQITAEIFVHQGFDAAINLDRESFNFSHPHYQLLVKWLHSAIRQLTNRHKEEGKVVRKERLHTQGQQALKALDKKINEMLEARGVEDIAEVRLLTEDSKTTAAQLRREGTLAFRRSEVIPEPSGERKSDKKGVSTAIVERKVIAIAKILDAWGLLKELSHADQEKLLREIAEVMEFRGEE
jgi:hypothetical protein